MSTMLSLTTHNSLFTNKITKPSKRGFCYLENNFFYLFENNLNKINLVVFNFVKQVCITFIYLIGI
jgi:hypothetical protein